MKTTLLIDADIVAYSAAATGQETFDWGHDEDGPTMGTFTRPLQESCDAASSYIDAIATKLKADDVVVCLSCATADCWRKDVLPTYKWNRNPAAKPVQLLDVKAYLAERYRTYQRPRLEADDVMGILSTHPTLIPGKKIIVSIDKDMKSIPGWLFNPDKDKHPHVVMRAEADTFHMYQTLVGDSTDGYKGCPSIGPVKADALLKSLWGMSDEGLFFPVELVWPHIVGQFKAKGLTEADALTQAQVARICRHTDYDYKRKEVILWSPSSSSGVS